MASDYTTVTISDRTKAAFESARDICKQLLTVTTAILTFTISFLKDVAESASHTAIMCLRGSWAAFAVSVMAGVIALFMLTGNIDAKHHMDDPSKAKELKIGNSIYVANIQVPFAIQLILFMLGTALFFVFGYLTVVKVGG